MAVFLVRHASAGTRDDSDPDDAVRRLDERGVAQAIRLAEQLDAASADIALVEASPAVRCVETVEPIASTVGLPVKRADALLEGSDIDAAWAALEAAARIDGDAVLCSHGDLIPELVSRARGRGMRITGGTGCKKASVWVLSWDGERFTDGRYEPPPE